MSSKQKNEKEKEKKNGNENDETLMSSKDDDGNENENYNDDDDDDDDDEMSQKEKIKDLNDILDEIIDKSKSFEKQIKSLGKVENLQEYWYSKDYGDKRLKFKYFKLKVAYLSKVIDKRLFEQIFGHTIIKLANRLINTTGKEENQIVVNYINKNYDKLYEEIFMIM